MLKNITAKTYFLFTYMLVGSIQLYATYNHQLFGDEAFYWLEGQWLDWSYSEVPGWTPWTLAFMDWLLPHHQFFIRLPNLIAALSIPWLGIFVSRALTADETNSWLVGLLLLALPILGVAGTLAIPDVWLVFFTLLAVWCLIHAVKSKQRIYFLLLGLVLALGINVHIRFWLVILITCGVVFWQFRSNRAVISQLLKCTLPIMVLGFVPVLLFNLQHDFALLSFQLKDRHPWEFQPSHLNFFLIQIVITTPWVFYLCLKNLKSTMTFNANNPIQAALVKTIAYAAAIHWLVYAVLGFFSDDLRLNVHWTLVSLVLFLVITTNTAHSARLKRWAVVTGITANLWLLITLSYWLHVQTPHSQLSARITNHALGWQQLAAHTDALLIRENHQQLLTDHFMTLAQLKFYAKQIKNIKAIPHPLNGKHGRAKQLEIMGLLQEKSQQPQLLVVEHSALKLAEQVDFYLSTCEYLNGLKLIDSLDIRQGLKRHHYFKTGVGDGLCDLPPVVYYEFNDQVLSGWILQHKSQVMQLSLYDASKQTKLTHNIELTVRALGSNTFFAKLNTDHYQLLEFKLNDLDQLADESAVLQLKLDFTNHTIYSQRLILNP